MRKEMAKKILNPPHSGILSLCLLLSVLAFLPQAAAAKDNAANDGRLNRYIIELQDPPLASFDGRELSFTNHTGKKSLTATATQSNGGQKLNLASAEALSYLEYITGRHEAFRQEAEALLGRPIVPTHQYRLATNGMALDLSEEEANILASSPFLNSISRDVKYRLDTFAGPKWIGAGEIWSGLSGFPAARGEDIIVGIIDSGINWESPSFNDPSPDGYNHTNPLGQQLGLCELAEVECNNKLIGVYDFVEDDPGTQDSVEENTNGRDNDGHGTHVASIAVGNPVNVLINDSENVTLSGVASRANVIAYRVCYIGEPQTADSGGCMGSAILSAIDQAIADGVDAVNYSIGSGADNPWRVGSIARAFLSARGAGIFVATSAGNSGPNPGTVGSPANAPWMIAVGNATHNNVSGSLIRNLVGGDTPPPDDLAGASLTGGTGQLQIVHASDFGNALCGAGEAELQATCDGNQGTSNPWAGQQPFNGQIVVCDRGTYGRVEKGKNVFLAGAAGYILANNADFGESIVADEHCLPASHIGKEDGDTLRNWLASGSGHGGSISGFGLIEADRFGDQLSISTSRGPALPPVEDTLKPNLIAPGQSILAAEKDGAQYGTKSGTSMASPHITGAAALLKSVHRDWNVSQLVSAIETTATAEQAIVTDGSAATPNDRGAGRPRLGEAANAGLYLNVTATDFTIANPATGGQPGNLNLAGLVDSSCTGSCSFLRTVTDQMGGGNWTATAVDFPEGVDVTIDPPNFSLTNGASRSLSIDIDLSASADVGEWVTGNIRLSAAGSPDQLLTVSVYSSGGELPAKWALQDDRNGGWQVFSLSGLESLVVDSSRDNPYDGGPGVYTKWYSLPQGGLWLYTETLASTAIDLDLYVGRDDNGNGLPEKSEELCTSTSAIELERCDLFDLPPGDYWIIVQNWDGTNAGGDDATLLSAAIGTSSDSNLAASGPGMVETNEPFNVRVSWDNLNALPGETWLGAVGIGSNRGNPNNIGVIPVELTRGGIADPETFPLMEGETHRLALDAGARHDRVFIDIPVGTTILTVTASGADAAQNDGLTLELARLDFADALSVPPFATAAGAAGIIASDTGDGGVGPSVTVAANLQPGRWYAIVSNTNETPSAVEIHADVTFQGTPVDSHRGLWEPSSRPGLGQGFDYNWGGNNRALIWYTYDEDGQPVWFIAGDVAVQGNIWTTDLLRVTNDGASQQLAPVGKISVTSIAENDILFSYTLYGQSATERMQPLSALTCPQQNGSQPSYTGIWYRGVDGLGGASIVVNAITQAQIHYLFDVVGMPRWLVAQDLADPSPLNGELPILQFTGYCAVCDPAPVSFEIVGMVERSFGNETEGSWTLDYLFQSPLEGSVERTDQVIKLTDTLGCQ